MEIEEETQVTFYVTVDYDKLNANGEIFQPNCFGDLPIGPFLPKHVHDKWVKFDGGTYSKD